MVDCREELWKPVLEWEAELQVKPGAHNRALQVNSSQLLRVGNHEDCLADVRTC